MAIGRLESASGKPIGSKLPSHHAMLQIAKPHGEHHLAFLQSFSKPSSLVVFAPGSPWQKSRYIQAAMHPG